MLPDIKLVISIGTPQTAALIYFVYFLFLTAGITDFSWKINVFCINDAGTASFSKEGKQCRSDGRFHLLSGKYLIWLQTVSHGTAFAQKQDHRDASVKYRSGYVLDSHYKHREVSPAGGRNQGQPGEPTFLVIVWERPSFKSSSILILSSESKCNCYDFLK